MEPIIPNGPFCSFCYTLISLNIEGILSKGPICHAEAWRVGPFWQDTLVVLKTTCMIYCIKLPIKLLYILMTNITSVDMRYLFNVIMDVRLCMHTCVKYCNTLVSFFLIIWELIYWNVCHFPSFNVSIHNQQFDHWVIVWIGNNVEMSGIQVISPKWHRLGSHMMTSSNGNIFRVTGPLCGEFTGHRWIPRTKASDAELWSFCWINNWVNNHEAGDLRCHHAHYDVSVMGRRCDRAYAHRLCMRGWVMINL